MYPLDTNVVSELRKAGFGKADRRVVLWVAATPAAAQFVSGITVMEIELGILRLERRDGAQGAALRRWLDDRVLPSFLGRILDVDLAVIRCCAALHVPDPRAERDALIAATAMVHGMSVVTRDASDFTPSGVPVVNPWNG